jgi:hypothetical protein
MESGGYKYGVHPRWFRKLSRAFFSTMLECTIHSIAMCYSMFLTTGYILFVQNVYLCVSVHLFAFLLLAIALLLEPFWEDPFQHISPFWDQQHYTASSFWASR